MKENTDYYQQLYWREFVQTQAQIAYLDCYELECERTENAINMITAIASSSSIAAWAVWQKASFVWGAIIAAAQVLNAVKRFLPYRRRLKAITGLKSELADIFITAQRHWFSVAEGGLTEREIHERTMKLREQKSKASVKHLKGIPLPDKQRCRQQSKERTEAYFANLYGRGGSNG